MAQDRSIARIRRTTIETEEPVQPWIDRFLDHARLAAIVYRDTNPPPTPPGWTPQETVDDRKTSLYYEVWDRPAGDARPAESAIVFRGTHEAKDWWSNARWATRFLPVGWDQYTVVRAQVGAIVARARQRQTGCRMLAIGHSLGGGLAQQAAYAHDEVKSVVAFDPSPVTGFRSVPAADRARNAKGIEIHRVYEKGEILSFLRGPLKLVVPLSAHDPSITEVRFDLTRGLSIKEHSMTALALAMAAYPMQP